MKKLSTIVLILFLASAAVFAQKTVNGTIKDASGVPLIGANVIVKGTSTGTITDIDGNYSLTVPEGYDMLEVSYAGFTTQEVSVSDVSTADIVLATGALLDEIVVTGTGAGISKKRLSTTVDEIDAADVDKLPSNQIDQLLQSNAPSAQIRLSSGQPGTSAIIRTRGPISASGSSTPVIIVDGIRVDNLNSNPELGIGTGGADISALADIPVESIEKIEYIKGGAATTLYGADAANGVIQIITKKGKLGRTTPFVEFRLGTITAEDKWLKYDRTGEALFEPGSLSEFKAGLSGGTEKFSYNFVGSLYQDDGFNDLNEQYKRSFNFGFNSKMADNLIYQGSFSYTGFSYNLDYNANTSFSRFSAAEGGAFGNLDSLTTEEWDVIRTTMRARGPLTDITQRVNRLTASNKITYSFLDDFTTNLTVGIENRNSRQQEVGSNAFQIEVGALGEGTTDQAYLNRSLRNAFTTTVDWNITNQTELSSLSFITTAGARFFRTNDYQELLGASGGVDGTSSVNNFAEKTSSDFALENANYGFYFLENIGFKDKIFLEFGGTLDKNTSAGADVGFQFLPKIGIVYNSGEINQLLSNVRVRANYGEATNFAQPFSQDQTFALESFLGNPSFRFDNPGNRLLRSERVKTSEVGIDFNLFDYRLNLSSTYYNALTVDALFTPNNIPSSGQLAQITNIGEIKNTGFEFALNANLIRSGKHNLNFRASYNVNNNEVSNAGGSPPFVVGGFNVIGSWIEEGQSLGFLRGTASVLQDDGTYTFEPNTFLGSSFAPKFGSFGLDYSFGNFSLYATSDYQFGGTNVDLSLLLRYLRGVDDSGRVPEELEAQPFFNVVNFFTDPSDFVKVRNIGAAYEFGNVLGDKVSGLRVGLTLTNPFNWTAASFDPEVTGSGIGNQNGFSSGGFAYGTESAPRQIIGSVKIQF